MKRSIIEPASERTKGRRAVALLVLVVVVGVAIWQGLASYRKVVRQSQVAVACDAARQSRWSEALSLSEGLAGPDSDGQIAAGCRCTALLAMGRKSECADLFGVVMGDGSLSARSLPASLIHLAARSKIERGAFGEARKLVAWGRRTYPQDDKLIQDEFEARLALEDTKTVLAEYETALGRGAASLGLRMALAKAYLRQGDPESGLRALGETWPPPTSPTLESWFFLRLQMEGALGDLRALKRSFARMRAIQGNTAELDAHYALRLSISGLSDPDHNLIDLLRIALARKDEIDNDDLVGWLYARLIGQLLTVGRAEEALAVFDEADGRYKQVQITRGQIERAVAYVGQGTERDRAAVVARGVIRFRVLEAKPGDQLLVSNNGEQPPDRSYRSYPLFPRKEVALERHLSAEPERWVLVDTEGGIRASGSVWPNPGAEVAVEVRRGPVSRRESYAPVVRAAGDGRRRVFAVILDCGDWRLAQYLRERGELPFLDYALKTGRSAVLHSEPPVTAFAMESLVRPVRSAQVNLLGLFYRMGLEIGGLESVGVNPLEALSGLLPASPSLFETLGAGDLTVANMLFSHGGIHAGRNAEITGPRGRKRKLRSYKLFRTLRPEEIRQMPAVETDWQIKKLSEEMAGEFDAAVKIATDRKIDFLFLRIEGFDILTHTLFSQLAETHQDDGRAGLLDVYRYVDGRLAELYAALDDDDVLVVMSDHGIRTAMQHESDALFVALGKGIPQGRAEGTPPLVGVSRALASLLGVITDWPDGGVLDGLSSSRLTWREPTDPAPHTQN